MDFLTLALFFIYLWGLGFAFTRFVRESDNPLERNLMRLGIGLGVVPFIGILLNLLHIPVDWRVFLLLSLVVPLGYLFFNLGKIKLGFKFRLTKSNIALLVVILLFLGTFFMYHKGAFSYPYFEDDDPWEHSATVKYIANEKKLSDPNDVVPYLDPYPPGYDILMGILHQTSGSVVWVLKFFNLLIISLSIIFFYFFAKEFMGSSQKALFATFVLAAIPSYQSHFIWAHSLAVTLFFPAMYCLERIKHDKRWMYTSLFVISGILFTHPTESIKLGGMMLIYFVVKSLYHRRVEYRVITAQVGAFALSFIWWAGRFAGYLQARFASVSSHAERLAAKGIEVGVSQDQNIIMKGYSAIKTVFPASSGTATRAYSFSDFVIARKQNMINNPIGVGIVLSILLLVAIIYMVMIFRKLKDKKHEWLVISLLWFVMTFLLVNSMTFMLPIGIFAFRVWMLMAIPIALLAAQGMWFLAGFFKSFGINRIIIFALVITGIVFTSGVQRYAVNTAIWPPGSRGVFPDELQAHMWLLGLPEDTKVFTFSDKADVIAFDKFICYWCEEEIAFMDELLDKNSTEVYNFLKRKRYEYLIVGIGMTQRELDWKFGENKTRERFPKLMEEIVSSGNFRVAHQTNGAVVFRVV